MKATPADIGTICLALPEVELGTSWWDRDSPLFTIGHFKGYNAVLVQESRLGEFDCDVLAEILLEAWACKAPSRLVRAYTT
ncbi:MAG TPA: hypothetical protein VGF80_15180 [Galbitalea sp.]|jgi:hypothetical protein